MTDPDVLAFVVWGGALFNVGFLAGWFACRRVLRRSSAAKEFTQDVRGPKLLVSGKTSPADRSRGTVCLRSTVGGEAGSAGRGRARR
jgi:hypothetical protein